MDWLDVKIRFFRYTGFLKKMWTSGEKAKMFAFYVKAAMESIKAEEPVSTYGSAAIAKTNGLPIILQNLKAVRTWW